MLVSKEVRSNHNHSRRLSKEEYFHSRESRGQKVWSDTRGNGPDDSINVDKYLEGIGQKDAMKYLKGKLLSPH